MPKTISKIKLKKEITPATTYKNLYSGNKKEPKYKNMKNNNPAKQTTDKPLSICFL